MIHFLSACPGVIYDMVFKVVEKYGRLEKKASKKTLKTGIKANVDFASNNFEYLRGDLTKEEIISPLNGLLEGKATFSKLNKRACSDIKEIKNVQLQLITCTRSQRGNSFKSYWTALITGWVTIWVKPGLYASGNQALVFHNSHLCDSTWANFLSILYWLKGLSPGFPVFLPPQNRLAAKIHLAVVLCSEIIHGRYSGSQRHPIYAFNQVSWGCAFCKSAPEAALKGD